MSSTIGYRSEIDGLRAIAVIAVILFHLDPSWLPGGFLGVDVFFVISGYLITAIIQRNIDSRRFSIWDFWSRRIKRLYPALMAMVCAVVVLGNFILIRPERQDLVKQTIAAIFSFSNILLWRSTDGYWDASSDNIALLHTWSLSLEEQFYLIFPTFLFLLNRFARPALLPTIGALTLISFGLCIYWTNVDRSGAFYLLPTRLWELSLGSLLALLEIRFPSLTRERKSDALLAAIGLLAVCASFWIIENDERFPGALPLLPCAGTLALLAFTRGAGATRSLLKLPPFTFIGRISYSLYLWHWPVIVFAHFLSADQHTILLLAITFALATASYYFVETPFRKGFRGSLLVIGGMPAVAGLCLLLIVMNPSSPGLPAKLKDLDSWESLSRGGEYEATKSLLSNGRGVMVGEATDQPDILLVGSSHARVLAPAFAKFAADQGLNLEVLATSAVEVTRYRTTQYSAIAKEVNDARMELIANRSPKVLIIVGMWTSEYKAEGFAEHLSAVVEQAARSAENVIVLSQVPMMDLPVKYARDMRKYLLACDRSGESLNVAAANIVKEANTAVERITKQVGRANVRYLDAHSPLTDEHGFVTYMLDDKLLYSDRHHLNDRGAHYLFDRAMRSNLAGLIKPIEF